MRPEFLEPLAAALFDGGEFHLPVGHEARPVVAGAIPLADLGERNIERFGVLQRQQPDAGDSDGASRCGR